MKSAEETVNGGANRTKLVEEVRKSFSDYNQLKNERDQINADMGEIRAGWKAMGLSVKGIKAGLTRANLDQDMRELFDESYDLAADALGIPIESQMDFFEREDFVPEPEAENEDPDAGDEQDELTDEEKALAGQQHGDGSQADLGKGMHFENEQEEGDAAIAALMPETAKAKEKAQEAS